MRYSVQPDAETTSRALGRDLPIKPKHAVNVLRAIRGKDVEKVKAYLAAVIEGKQAVPFVYHKRQV
ncbi:MAG TPA: 50S ribosomal protein L22, partial [Candidatus Thermoplasmatota archaeon]|nr:50S ribosomal protein L22 [Candidatus Thermoplasmatota archaeon]